ncbi:MAG: hypothetical protein WED00_12565 [Aquisalimonadaceae bacterium]
MKKSRVKTAIPTLTYVACPGELLRERGLWLPLRPLTGSGPDDSAWRTRLPQNLQDKADRLIEETRRRAEAAVDAALGTADDPARPRLPVAVRRG